MEKLKIESSGTSPLIDFDFEIGIIEIKGRSTMENAFSFYARLVEAIKKYSQTPRETTTINITLDWFNTGSSKALLDIFRELDTIYKAGNKVLVNWYYEQDDEDMLEAGEDYQAIINIPFKIIEIED